MGIRSSSCRAWTTPKFWATPPVITTSGWTPTRWARPTTRWATDLADHFALGKYGAGRADGHLAGGLGPQPAQVLDLDLQHAGHHVQEAAGAGGALVVHLELGHGAVLDVQHLDVLAADVDDGARPREEEAGPLRVAGQLAHLLVGDVHQAVAAVAGGQGEGHVRLLHARVLQHLVDGPLGAAGAGADGDEGLGHDLLAVGQDDALGGGGADVDA